MSNLSKKIRIFVIGSRHDVILSIQHMIQMHIDEMELVGIADTGQEGIDNIKQLAPDFAMVDITTPDMNTPELIQLLREHIPDSIIFAMSRSNNINWMRNCVQAGANDILSQPLLVDDVYTRMRSLYDRTEISSRDQD